MRGALANVQTPHRTGPRLPAIYLDENVVQEFCGALDDVLAPVVFTLDSFPAYLDPLTTPADMLEFIACWLGVRLDPRQPAVRHRDTLREVVALFGWRGTAKGLRDALGVFLGLDAAVEESGGTQWSATTGTALPGLPESRVIVRVTTADPDALDRDNVLALIDEWVPAHVSYELVVSTPPTGN